MRTVRAIDLFCGAGGSSTGLAQACEQLGSRLDLTAINHWQVAVETHSANHPDARHLCESMENLDPRKVWPSGKRLDVLWASPECTHHSVARGGRPINDQSRASAWHVVRWAEALRPSVVLVENVPEFETWGPLGRNGRPIARLRGEVYVSWRRALESLGYRVESRILNAADYGEATTRRRLFVQARLAGAPRWPEPTHAQEAPIGFCGAHRRWRPARDVIDWTLQGRSIFGRKKPLSARTIERIAEGLRRQGAAGEPFLVVLRNHAAGRSVAAPVPTLCAGGQHVGLAEPFLIGQQSGAVPRPVSAPTPTVAAAGAIAFVMPVTHAGVARSRPVSEPLPTVTTAHRGEHALVEPFVISRNNAEVGSRAPRAVGEPLPTATARGAGYLIEPFRAMLNAFDRALGEEAAQNAVAEPFLTKHYSSGGGMVPTPIGDPVPTLTTKDRIGLCEPCGLDIHFRMLQPHELAAAMGFPDGYKFSGNKGDAVRQIGNAVSVRTAKALAMEVLG